MTMDQIILGNIYTLDRKVEAVCVKDGIIQYTGSKRVALQLIDENTEILDFGDNFIYPGFMEGHAHGLPAGNIKGFSIDLSEGKTLEDYVEITRKYVEDNPGRKIYTGNGWKFDNEEPTASMLDDVSADVPIALTTQDGHSIWLNTAAMEYFDIDEKLLEKYSTNEVRVDDDGRPTGYLSEEPAITLNSRITKSDEEMQESLLIWQEFAFSNGITAALDAHVGYYGYPSIKAYADLSREGKLKLRTYAVRTVGDTDDVLDLIKLASEVNNEYFRITGVKVFGASFIGGILSAQLARTAAPTVLRPISDVIARTLGPANVQTFINALRTLQGKTAIYGAAANNSFIRALQSSAISQGVFFIVFSAADTYRLMGNKISGSQYAKNIFSLAAGMSGTAASSIAAGEIGRRMGKKINPKLGQAIGFAAGFAGGMVSSIAAHAIGNLFKEDDSVISGRLMNAVLCNMAYDYLMSEEEMERLVEILGAHKKEIRKIQSQVRTYDHQYNQLCSAFRLYFEQATNNREVIDSEKEAEMIANIDMALQPAF